MTLSELFKNIADAIRGKEGSTDSIPATDFASRISAIETGVDTSDATVTADKILDGYTGYAKGVKVTGNIPNKTSSDLTVNGDTVTVPAGHYVSQVTKSVDTATQATPSISVSSAGLITASTTQTAGYVTAGTQSVTKQLTTQAATTITPGTSDKTAVDSGVYTTGAITVAGDSELVMSNIKNGVEIFGVIGSYTGRSVKIGTFDSSISVGYSDFNGSRFVITFPSGFDASSVVAFNLGGFRNGNYTSQPMIGMLDEYSNSIKAHLYNYNSDAMNGLSIYHWASGSNFSIGVNQLVCSSLDTAVSNIFQYAGYGYYVYLE